MFNLKLHPIKLEYLSIPCIKDSLVKMSTMSEQDVVKMWHGPSTLDLINMKYHYDAPLYEKMVWRFRQANASPFGFAHRGRL